MHQLLRLKSRFPNHFELTRECYLFLLFLVIFISMIGEKRQLVTNEPVEFEK